MPRVVYLIPTSWATDGALTAMAGELRVRLGVHNLSADQVTAFRGAYRQIMQISDTAAINSSRGCTEFQAGIAGTISITHAQRSKSSFFCLGIAPIFTISK
jgi:hypothetical protein